MVIVPLYSIIFVYVFVHCTVHLCPLGTITTIITAQWPGGPLCCDNGFIPPLHKSQ